MESLNHQLAIVIPAYKSTFLRETLESIANQTDKSFHLYIGDDCSPHDIESIVNEFRDRISITYKRFEKNLGGTDLVAQWERCISMTQDEPYIWLFSDDDTMDSGCVEAFYNSVEKHPDTDVFRYDVKVIDNEGKLLRTVKYPEVISAIDLYRKKINGSLECFVVEYIFKRSVYVKEKGFVNFDLAWGSDLATWVKFGKEKGIRTIPYAGLSWRSSGINISTDNNPEILKRKVKALINCLHWGESIFHDNMTLSINEKGLISRLSSIAVANKFKDGIRGIKMYSNNGRQEMRLMSTFLLYYIYKKFKNVF